MAITSVTITDECIACEACVAVAPDALEMDGDKAALKEGVNLAEQSEALLQAVEECPVDAIEVETE